jgi:hypothetical protein
MITYRAFHLQSITQKIHLLLSLLSKGKVQKKNFQRYILKVQIIQTNKINKLKKKNKIAENQDGRQARTLHSFLCNTIETWDLQRTSYKKIE